MGNPLASVVVCRSGKLLNPHRRPSVVGVSSCQGIGLHAAPA